MAILTAHNIVRAISQLPRDRTYEYINPGTRTKLAIESVTEPNGPIRILRWNPSNGEGKSSASHESISTGLIGRYANAFAEGLPINIDRVVGASYNTRSALESLLAHTPEFYYCYPGRNERDTGGNWTIKRGHKHLMWMPNQPHTPGVMQRIDTSYIVTELSAPTAYYDDLVLPPTFTLDGLSGNQLRRHTMIQIALYVIGLCLGYKTYIAQNDQGIQYNGRALADHEGMMHNLSESLLLSNYGEAVRAGRMIDVVWFKNDHLMPAIMEVEHTTGVVSGLSRMKNFYDRAPRVEARYVIVADDEDREKVIRGCSQPQFEVLKPKYFPYSAVEELFAFCQNRKHLRGVSEEFIDNFMEDTLLLPQC